MKKITAFQYVDGVEHKRLSYTYNEVDGNGEITKSNIRKSLVIKEENLEVVQAVNTLINFLIDESVTPETEIIQEKIFSLEQDNLVSLEALAEIYEQVLILQEQVNGGI